MRKLTQVTGVERLGEAYLFECPGCMTIHVVWTERLPGAGGTAWAWNGSLEAPTFNPSLLVREYNGDDVTMICHSFISNGRIQFLPDCTHHLKGQTVEMPDAKD